MTTLLPFSKRSRFLSIVIGRLLGLKRGQLRELGMSAILHDVEKIFVG
jgi:HD-GYP domain-containing protein (c-di-GMP phosphodiesterase class II)